jgi:putative oxidoreductase
VAFLTEQPEYLKHGALLPPRFALGSTMLYHGTKKLSRKGIEAHAPFFEQIGISPGRPWVVFTGLVETAAGALAILGIGTRLAALGVLATQSVAINRVHALKGFANEKQGVEFNLALCAMALGLLLRGPGRFSVHSLLERAAKKRELKGFRFLPRQRRLSRFLEALG